MTREEILEKRRVVFEAWIINNDRRKRAIERDENGKYLLLQTCMDWSAWNAALDSVVIELPNVTVSQCVTAKECRTIRCGIDMCRVEIEEQGYRTK